MDLTFVVPAAIAAILVGWFMRPREHGSRVWRVNAQAAVIMAMLWLPIGYFLLNLQDWRLLAGVLFGVIVLFGPMLGAWARRSWMPRQDTPR